MLPTGRRITPTGTPQDVGSLPTNLVLTPDGKYALVSDTGFRENLSCLSADTRKLALPGTRSLLSFPNTPDDRTNGLYYGLAISSAAAGGYTVYVAQGSHATVAVVHVAADGGLQQTGVIRLQPGEFAAGLALDAKGRLYVTINETEGRGGIVGMTTPGALVVYDTAVPGVVVPLPGSSPAPEVARVAFTGPTDTFGKITVPSDDQGKPAQTIPFTPDNFPFSVAALADGSRVYVSSQRDDAVYALDFTVPGTPRVHPIKTGSHPVGLLLNHAQTKLYVADAQSDDIAIVDTHTEAIRRISARPQTRLGRLPGVSPNGLALSPDENTLYATLGDLNAVAVVDLSTDKVRGTSRPAGIRAL